MLLFVLSYRSVSLSRRTGSFLSLYVFSRSCLCMRACYSSSSSFDRIYLSVSLLCCLVTVKYNIFLPLFLRVVLRSRIYLSVSFSYPLPFHQPVLLFMNSTLYCYRSLYSDGTDLGIDNTRSIRNSTVLVPAVRTSPTSTLLFLELAARAIKNN